MQLSQFNSANSMGNLPDLIEKGLKPEGTLFCFGV